MPSATPMHRARFAVLALAAVAALPGAPAAQHDGTEAPSPDELRAAHPPVVTYQPPKTNRPPFEGRAYVSALANQRPRRIAPGQSGTLVIVLAMAQSAVMDPAGSFLVQYEGTQGAFTLGGWSRLPPKPVMRYAAFEDRLVYDNTAQVEIPITVAAGTEHGTQKVSVEIDADLLDGKTGGVLGTYHDTLSCGVTVGPPVPTPVPRLDAVPAAASDPPGPAAPPAAAAPGVAVEPVERAVDPVPGGTAELLPAQAEPEVGSAGDRAEATEPGAGSEPWLFAALAAVVVVLLGLLLLRRRVG